MPLQGWQQGCFQNGSDDRHDRPARKEAKI